MSGPPPSSSCEPQQQNFPIEDLQFAGMEKSKQIQSKGGANSEILGNERDVWDCLDRPLSHDKSTTAFPVHHSASRFARKVRRAFRLANRRGSPIAASARKQTKRGNGVGAEAIATRFACPESIACLDSRERYPVAISRRNRESEDERPSLCRRKSKRRRAHGIHKRELLVVKTPALDEALAANHVRLMSVESLIVNSPSVHPPTFPLCCCDSPTAASRFIVGQAFVKPKDERYRNNETEIEVTMMLN
nr:hypothetical protein Iba_chr12cCG13460 [Ipomoea batatas]